MPIQRFWMLSKNIDRVRAEESSAHLMIAVSSQAAESAKQCAADLHKQMGSVIVYDLDADEVKGSNHRRDPHAGATLKALAGLK